MGLGFELENKVRSKEDKSTTKSLMANLDTTLLLSPSLFVGHSILLPFFLSLSLPFSLPSSFSLSPFLSAQGEGARCFDAAEGIRSYSRDPWTAGKIDSSTQ